MSNEEVRHDYLNRLGDASESALWVCAADKLHNANSVIADIQRTIEPGIIWSRFKAGKEGTVWWYRAVYSRLQEVGFQAPIMPELKRTVERLEELGRAS